MPDFFITRGNISMYVELKVGNSDRVAYIEAFPLMANQQRERSLLVPTLYVYAGNITGGNMVASYSQDIISNKLIIPKRNEEIKPLLQNWFTCDSQERETKVGTSGDAFVIVKKKGILQWKPLDEYIKKA